MTQDEIVKMARKAGLVRAGDKWVEPARWGVTELIHFAALVAQRERDQLVVMFLEAHEGAKEAHNYWAVAANKIRARGDKPCK